MNPEELWVVPDPDPPGLQEPEPEPVSAGLFVQTEDLLQIMENFGSDGCFPHGSGPAPGQFWTGARTVWTGSYLPQLLLKFQFEKQLKVQTFRNLNVETKPEDPFKDEKKKN